MPAAGGAADPQIPAVTGECPAWASGTISFMGLGGITVQAGPKAAGPTAPMVLYWHGTGSFAGEFAGMAGAIAQGVAAEGGILISFQGSTGGDFRSGTSVFGVGDYDLVDQFVACAVRDHNVDPRRIYTTGCSAGGLFATSLAIERSSYIAAAAPNSGGSAIPLGWQNEYTPALMTMHGAPGVDVVFIDFSDTSATADANFKGRGGFVINCNHGGNHCGGGGLAGDAWEFFKAHPYGVDPYPWEGGLPAGFASDCMIY
jgi:poly(3-hydroxybutyrate) depolymerase